MATIGSSWMTPNKQEGFESILRLHMAICGRVFAKNHWCGGTYHYIDTTAGDGCNPEYGVDGSPVIFLRAIADAPKWRAWFIDRETANAARLRVLASADPRVRVIEADNSIAVPSVLSTLDRSDDYGLLYHDPNGMPNIEMLARAALERKHLDILIRYNANSMKRNGRAVSDLLGSVPKERWLVRRLHDSDTWQWTFLFGTNYSEFPEWRKHDFICCRTPEGRRIMLTLQLTTKQQIDRRNGWLFDDPAEEVKRRSGGICEYCGSRPATELHHLEYGPTTTAASLVHLCHFCHCKAEGRST